MKKLIYLYLSNSILQSASLADGADADVVSQLETEIVRLRAEVQEIFTSNEFLYEQNGQLEEDVEELKKTNMKGAKVNRNLIETLGSICDALKGENIADESERLKLIALIEKEVKNAKEAKTDGANTEDFIGIDDLEGFGMHVSQKEACQKMTLFDLQKLEPLVRSSRGGGGGWGSHFFEKILLARSKIVLF
jgi:hypothetical protein